MARHAPHLVFDAFTIEGGLFTADFLNRIAEETAGQQTVADYRLPKGLQLRDEIGRAWRIAAAHWSELDRASKGGAERLVQATILAMLRDAFGWLSLKEYLTPPMIGDRTFPITAQALGERLPLLVAPWETGLDTSAPSFGDSGRRRTPFGLVQDWLNASDGALWGVVTNGRQLRLVRDNASLTRPAWIEVDLERIMREQRYADFSVLWLLLHESRFGGADTPPYEAILEQWRVRSLEAGTAARAQLREGVEQAIRLLGAGFLAHPNNGGLREALTSGRLDAMGYHQQLLRLVYRLIFLLVVEERELLHPSESDPEAQKAYAEGYGLRVLRERAARRRAYDRHDDAWVALRIVFQGCAEGEPRLALPALGGLFALTQCQNLDGADLGNSALLGAVFHLAWLPQRNALVRVNWREMGTEELGSVYESLLELVPEIRDEAHSFGFFGDGTAMAKGNARKLTGSYYTPDSLVQALLDSALEPVIERALISDDPQAALLGLAVVDPACGSGHFLLGAGRRLAGHLARVRSGGTPVPSAYRAALRDVTRSCLYGVDKNAMAVELARIALWLEAMVPDQPLVFLDHHLVHGDALLGVMDLTVLSDGIPDAAFDALTGDDKPTARELKRVNASARKEIARERKSGQVSFRFDATSWAERLRLLDAMPDHTPAAVAAKGEALAALLADRRDTLRDVCDAWAAAFFLPKTVASRATVPTTATLRDLALGIQPSAIVREAVEDIAASTPFLHWPIVFAPVMARGGFDGVLGNPPWEKLKLSEEEFFASRAPDIAGAANKAARQRAIDALREAPLDSSERRLFSAFERAKQEAEGGSNFAHEAGRFVLTGRGDVNLYALFAETGLALANPMGRAGLVLPSGIASDAGTAPFFSHIADGRLVSLIDFENREALFHGVHRSYKFCLLTMGRSESATFAFFLTQAEQRFDQRRVFILSLSDLARLNPNTKTCPVFRSQEDAALTTEIYRRVPVLWDEEREDGNPWGISFLRLFDMATDSHLFSTQHNPDLVPLYEAKMVHQYDHRWATYTNQAEEGSSRDATAIEKSDPTFSVRPRYWVPREEVDARLTAKTWNHGWLLGWRDICRATDERTVIASLIPRAAVGDTFLLMFPGPSDPATAAALLLGDQNSLPHDYVARQKVGGTHLKYHTKRQITNLAPLFYTVEIREKLLPRILELVYTAEDLRPFYEDLIMENACTGLKGSNLERDSPFLYDSARRAVLRAELDALYAKLYGLTRDELRYVLDPADFMGPDYPSETFRVLKQRELKEYGEYRTQRLVLEAWDRLVGTR